jgi:hypothetical protein
MLAVPVRYGDRTLGALAIGRPLAPRAEDAQADQTRFLERTVTGSPQPHVLSLA